MADVLSPVKTPKERKRQSMPRPRGAKIVLLVCDCHMMNTLTLVKSASAEVAKLLRITEEDLEDFAIRAMLSGDPQVVQCYNQVEIAETVLQRLRTIGSFINRSCHDFFLTDG